MIRYNHNRYISLDRRGSKVLEVCWEASFWNSFFVIQWFGHFKVILKSLPRFISLYSMSPHLCLTMIIIPLFLKRVYKHFIIKKRKIWLGRWLGVLCQWHHSPMSSCRVLACWLMGLHSISLIVSLFANFSLSFLAKNWWDFKQLSNLSSFSLAYFLWSTFSKMLTLST